MEILELIWILVQGCGCFLDVLATFGWVGAGGAALRAREKKKQRDAIEEERRTPEPDEMPPTPQEEQKATTAYERSMFLFLALLVLSIGLTALAVWRWVR